MRSVTVRLDDLKTMIMNLGFVGENEHTRVMIDAKKMYDQYPHAIASLTVCPPSGASYPAVIERDGDMVIWDITDSDLTAEGSGEIQLSFTAGEVVAKTYIGRFRVSRSIIPTGAIPEPLDDFLTRAGAALTAIPETIDESLGQITAEAETLAAGSSATAEYNNGTKKFSFGIPKGDKGDTGDTGAPGYSPCASVSKSGDTATITITDKDGTTTATVKDGADGQDGAPGADGYSPSASVSKTGTTATITITDKTGTTSAQISDGDPTALIDDTAGSGDTDKVWSADKTASECSSLKNEINAVAEDVEDIQENEPEFVGFKCYTKSSGGDWPDGGKIIFNSNIGYIAKADGQVKNAGTGTWKYSDFIPIDRLDGDTGVFMKHSNVANVAYYSDNTFTSYLWNESSSDLEDTVFSKSRVLSNAPTGTNYIVICTDSSRADLYAYLNASPTKITNIVENEPVFGKKIMHISFDDVNYAFQDLTTNANTYSSLFDSPFFGVLKDLHDDYGAVFSGYCFYNVYTSDQKTTLTFSLANATTKFKNEFAENSSWLRFGFHSIDNYTLYTSATYETAQTDWNTFVTRMVDVVGMESMDTVVRLQSFAGSLNACKGMRDASCGADGFLCSDYSETGDNKNINTSTGYYLTNDDAGICGRKGKFEDPANGLVFFATGWRIDYQNDIPSWLALFNTPDRFNRRRYMIIYGHENNMTSSAENISAYKAKLETICEWAKTNGYKFVFPADLIVY